MLTALLPSSSAPSSRSRCSSRRLTMPARGCPASAAASCWRATTRSAPSRCRRRTPTAAGRPTRWTSESQSFAVIVSAELALKKARTSAALDVVGDEGLPDAAQQDEGQPAALHFLVLGHQLHQSVDVPALRQATCEMGGQADAARCARDARGVGSPIRPVRAENSKASTMPSATASPCSRRRRSRRRPPARGRRCGRD